MSASDLEPLSPAKTDASPAAPAEGLPSVPAAVTPAETAEFQLAPPPLPAEPEIEAPVDTLPSDYGETAPPAPEPAAAFAAVAPPPVTAAPAPPAAPLKAQPTASGERITSIDVIRGFALLGILLMNIVGFGLYNRAYDNPTSAGGADGLNLWTWIILHVVAEGKMRCLFSLVFGASVVLLTSRLEGRPDAADIYYRRTLWLLVFGIVHSFLLWQGDILYPYAICALALYPFRNLRPKTLIIIGVVFMVALAAFNITRGFQRLDDYRTARAAAARAERNERLTQQERIAENYYYNLQARRNPADEFLRRDAEQWHGDFLTVFKARSRLVLEFVSIPYYHPINFDIWGMMFLGMGLFKIGVLSARRSLGFYAGLMAGGYAVGFVVNSITAWLLVDANFDPVVHLFTYCVYDIGRLTVALGHLSLLLLLCQLGWMKWLTSRLGAVGQMAFTNYIMTSLICAFVFTGYGLGLYGELQRYQLYYVVAGISLFQLVVSPIWLRHYRFGPLEWCWRALTYWQRPPMRLASPRSTPPAIDATPAP